MESFTETEIRAVLSQHTPYGWIDDSYGDYVCVVECYHCDVEWTDDHVMDVLKARGK